MAHAFKCREPSGVGRGASAMASPTKHAAVARKNSRSFLRTSPSLKMREVSRARFASARRRSFSHWNKEGAALAPPPSDGPDAHSGWEGDSCAREVGPSKVMPRPLCWERRGRSLQGSARCHRPAHPESSSEYSAAGFDPRRHPCLLGTSSGRSSLRPRPRNQPPLRVRHTSQ